MTNLVVCCDGTWNTPDQEHRELPSPTNVRRLYNALSQDGGTRQQRYYHPGVGTEGAFFKRLAGGMYGAGISKNIISAYVWLARHYQLGDDIFLFGFSRGAFTVRSLAGMLAKCGLLDLAGLEPGKIFKRAERAYEYGYRKGRAEWNTKDWPLRADNTIPIHFIGVWDTVGALGVPDDLALLNLLDKPENWRFHDTTLGERVEFARHAIAIDERRASFCATLWTDPETKRPLVNSERVKQLWFPGVHSDIGGGYLECGLSDIALKWMLDEASGKGLLVDEEMTSQVKPDACAPMHDSVRGVFKALRTRPRYIPPLIDDDPYLHKSAFDRHRCPPISDAPYHPTRMLEPGESVEISVYAIEHWNETGLYLEAGATYRFSAVGEWLDRKIPSKPGGTRDGKFNPGEIAHAIGSFIGKVEGIFKRISGNDEADFWATRRQESIAWFALVGVIANDGDPDAKPTARYDGSPSPHDSFKIGAGPVDRSVVHPGYLFAYANDAWGFYDNNRGSVMMTVLRID